MYVHVYMCAARVLNCVRRGVCPLIVSYCDEDVNILYCIYNINTLFVRDRYHPGKTYYIRMGAGVKNKANDLHNIYTSYEWYSMKHIASRWVGYSVVLRNVSVVPL